MLSNLKKTNTKGFTIIEVMIVLAIAGLILLIVLLAIPALQRNARNTAIKNDATSLIAAIQEYKSNNDGTNPGVISANGLVGAAGKAQAQAKLGANTTASDTTTPAVGFLGYKLDAICPSSTAATNRTVAIYYQVEASTNTTKCIEG